MKRRTSPDRATGPVLWRSVGRYTLAVLGVAAATLLRWVLPDILGPTPYLVFIPAIVAVAAFGGFGPALLATTLSVPCVDVLFTPPIGQFSDDPLEWARQAVFFAGGVGISLLAGMQRAAQQRQQQEAEELAAANRSAERAKAAAEHANQVKDHFMAVLSHELRTPLMPVLATASMLQQDERFDEQTREHLEVIRRNAELEARLIDDLLDVTRISNSKVQLHRCPVQLCTILRHAVEVCQPDIDARRLHFALDIQDPPYMVNADAGRLQQVFWNIIKNAVKFTPHDGCVGVRCWREVDHVLVNVSDSGVGIEPEALARIFNAFEQAEASVTRQFGGLGLGLAIAKALVELHGGTITAHSEGKGKGANFIVRLPLIPSPVPGAGAGPRPPQATRSGQPAVPLRILLVEDHGDTARIVARLLIRQGHQVHLAGDVATALEWAGRERFDLLLSDLGLPDGSGLDLLRELRTRGFTFPGIALSGYGQEHDVRESLAAGFALHLTKPVDVPRLADAIATVTGPAATLA